MSFLEIRFPVDISRHAQGGPRFRTQVVQVESGREDRNDLWTVPLRAYSVGLAITSQADLDDVHALFLLARGQKNGFRFKDWTDYRGTFELLGTGDGSEDEFQLRKGYTYSGNTVYRTITKPVAGSLTAYVDGSPAAATMDTTTGIVTFDTPPASAKEVRATFEFDVPVRFSSDEMVTQIETLTVGRWPVDLVEIRV